jgi:pyridoxine 4-dehydrogenase
MDRTLRLAADLEVGRLGFGAMQLCGPGGWGDPPDRPGALALLRRAVELGVGLIDTADAYGPESNERLIAEALHPYPPGLVVATKGGQRRLGPGAWSADGRPEHLRRACEASLRRLRRERIDLYQLHAVDPEVPLEESVGALDRLRQEGKVRLLGLCNVDAGQLRRARAVAPIATVQNRYNLFDRVDPELLALCERERIALICWFPLADGELRRGTGALGRIARDRGLAPAQVALAWLLARSPVTLPIPGTRSPAHLEQNLGALEVGLSRTEMAALEAQRRPAVARLRRLARGGARRGRRLARGLRARIG